MLTEKIKRNEHVMKPIMESFYVSDDNPNLSRILTKLIQETGRLCDSFASDLFIDWSIFMEKVEKKELTDGEKFVFGLREYGVDHLDWVRQNIDKPNYYRAVYIIDVTVEERNGEDYITLILGKF